MSDEARPFRLLPRIDDTNRHFWTGGEQGELRFLRCQRCGWWIHPPSPICPQCFSKDVAPDVVSGDAVVHTFTVNHQPWIPGFDPPYVVAIVELPEQDGLRLTTNIVGCEPEEVTIGMPVHVVFEQYEDVWLPLFRPVGA
jgi:uncharacterized OB-fold protein